MQGRSFAKLKAAEKREVMNAVKLKSEEMQDQIIDQKVNDAIESGGYEAGKQVLIDQALQESTAGAKISEKILTQKLSDFGIKTTTDLSSRSSSTYINGRARAFDDPRGGKLLTIRVSNHDDPFERDVSDSPDTFFIRTDKEDVEGQMEEVLNAFVKRFNELK